MENHNFALSGEVLIIGFIFIVIFIATTIKNIKDNLDWLDKYGMIFFTLAYIAFFVAIVYLMIPVDLFAFCMGSVVYLAVALSITDFSIL